MRGSGVPALVRVEQPGVCKAQGVGGDSRGILQVPMSCCDGALQHVVYLAFPFRPPTCPSASLTPDRNAGSVVLLLASS